MLNVQAKRLGSVAVLSLQGQVVNGETEILRDAVLSLSKSPFGISAIKLDLARVTTVDAGGLGVMLTLREQAESKGIRFELVNVNKRISMVLKLTRLDSVFQVTSGIEFFPAVSRNQRAALAVHATPLASCA
jgi:anti-anti-sigma factor